MVMGILMRRGDSMSDARGRPGLVSVNTGRVMSGDLPSVAFISGDWNTTASPPEANGCAYYRQVLPCRALQGVGFDAVAGLPRPHDPAGIGLAKDDGALFGFDVSVYKLMMHRACRTCSRDAGSGSGRRCRY
jgi:hypothetical protein